MAFTPGDLATGFVAQRRAGTTAVTGLILPWTLDTAPGAIQARVVKGAAVIADWQTCTSQTATGGVLPGPVPDGDGYHLEFREGTGGTAIVKPNLWGVGFRSLFMGQSNQEGSLSAFGTPNTGTSEFSTGMPALARQFGTTGWVSGFTSNGRAYFQRQMVAALGGSVPVGLIASVQSSTSIAQNMPGGSVWNANIEPTGTGAAGSPAGMKSPNMGDVEFVDYYQGEADAGGDPVVYKANLQKLCDGLYALVAPFGRTPSQLAISFTMVAGMTPASNIERIRRVTMEFVAEKRALGLPVTLSSALDIPSDGLHIQASDGGQARNLRRYVQAAKLATGTATYGARGPAIASITRAGNVLTVTVAHDGGTALHALATGALTGHYISTDGWVANKAAATATITGPSTYTVSLGAIPDTTPVWYKHLGAIPGSTVALANNAAGASIYPNGAYDGSSYPDIRNLIYDNAALPAQMIGIVSTDPSGGLPLQPFIWTLGSIANGATVNAPAGATTSSGVVTPPVDPPTDPTPTPAPDVKGVVAGLKAPIRRLGNGLILTTALMSGTVPVTPTTPLLGAVANLRQTAAANGTITWAWDALTGADGYVSRYRSIDSAIWQEIPLTTGLTATASGLATGAYIVEVTASAAGTPSAQNATITIQLGSAPALVDPFADQGTIWRVGAGRTLTTIEAAVAAASPGDTIRVDAGTYLTQAITKPNLVVKADVPNTVTIDGKGGLPTFPLAGGGKGGIYVSAAGNNVRIQGFNLLNCGGNLTGTQANQVAQGQAGIRVEGGAGTVRVDGCRFDGCEDGFFSNGPNSLYLSNCEFGKTTGNGASLDGQSHDVYVTTGTVLYEERNCFHWGNQTGHDLKSRALTTRVYGGYYAGKLARAFDIPQAGLFTALGPIISHSPTNGSNSIGIGAESLVNGTSQPCTITSATFIASRPGTAVVVGAGVVLNFSNTTQVWVNAGAGAPTVAVAGFPGTGTGTVTGLALTPGSATVLTSMPALPQFSYNAAWAAGAETVSGSTPPPVDVPVDPNPPTVTGTIPFGLSNPAGTAITEVRQRFAQPLVDGEVPAGSSLACANFPDFQADCISTWPNGSWRIANIAMKGAVSIPANGQINLPLQVVNQAQNATGAKTLADLRALSNITSSVYSGVGAARAVIGTASLHAIIDQFGGTVGVSKGTNPLGAIVQTRRGKACSEWQCETYMRGPDGTGWHAWIKVTFVVTIWKDNGRTVDVWIENTNTYGRHPQATFGEATFQAFYSGLSVEAFEGANRLPITGGGPNDPGVEQLTGAIFTANSATMNFPSTSNLRLPASFGYRAQGATLLFTGAGVPSGISQTKVYTLGSYGRHYLCDTYLNAELAGTAIGTLNTTGAVTMTPYLTLQIGACIALRRRDARCVEIAASTGISSILPALPLLDSEYMAKAAMFPRFDKSVRHTKGNTTSQDFKYIPNAWTQSYDIEGTGDSSYESRVGLVNWPEGPSILMPDDPVHDMFVRIFGLSTLVQPHAWTDERAGYPPVVNGGPTRDDTTSYPGLAPLNRNLRFYRGNAGIAATPEWLVSSPTVNPTLAPLRPFGYNYGVIDGSAHGPDHASLAYLRNGDVFFMRAAIQRVAVLKISKEMNARNQTLPNGTKLRGVNYLDSQPRSAAWSMRHIGNALAIAADWHPYKAVIRDDVADTMTFATHYVTNVLTDLDREYGNANLTNQIGNQPWHNSFMVASLCQEVKRGYLGFLPALKVAVRGQFLDILRPEKGGSTWFAECHHWVFSALYDRFANNFGSYLPNFRACITENLKGTFTASDAEMVTFKNSFAATFPPVGQPQGPPKPFPVDAPAPFITIDNYPANGFWYNGGSWRPYHRPTIDVFAASNTGVMGRDYATIKRGAVVLVVDVLDKVGSVALGTDEGALAIKAAPAVLDDLNARFDRAPNAGLVFANASSTPDNHWAWVPMRATVNAVGTKSPGVRLVP